MRHFDYLVVGSGCSGSMAAQTLVEAGKQVGMVDVGITAKIPAASVPTSHFTDLRMNDPNQYRYLLGESLEGVSWGKVGKGEQITPPRHNILEKVEEYIPIESDTFSPLESLAYGGLGVGWGLQCWEYSAKDLQKVGLPVVRTQKAYETVAARIGVSGTKDSAAKYTLGRLKQYQNSPSMDANHKLIYKAYKAQEANFQKQGLYMGRTPLALITEDFNGRQGYSYHDTDYYFNQGESSWRPWVTVNRLKQKPNFEYVANCLVLSFKETNQGVEVLAKNLQTKKEEKFSCKNLVLATNPMGSARIVLRSFGKLAYRLPLLCNPYTYVPCIQPRLVGKAAEKKKLGLAQLSLFLDKSGDDFDASVASLYDYHSLMLFRIVRQVPLNFADARIIMRYLMSGIEIMGIHHPDRPSSAKFVELTSDTSSPSGDKLRASYKLHQNEKDDHVKREKIFIKAMRKMHTYALRRVDPGHGASVHYAGTLPFDFSGKPFTLNSSGKLAGTRHVYVADSSGFNYLPAKGLTFTLLANAHLTAESILKDNA